MEAGYARNIEDESQNPEKGCLTFIDRFRDTNWARARIVPPTLTLGSNVADGNPDTLEKWTDPQQLWANGSELTCCYNGRKYRPLRLTTTGSDYLVFLADSTYFNTVGWDRGLSIRIKGLGPRPDGNQAFRIGYVLYDSYGTPKSVTKSELLGKTIKSVTESAPVTVTGDTLNTELTIPRFGRFNKGVLVVISMVEEDSLSTNFSNGKEMKYRVIYEFKDTYWDGTAVSGSFGAEDSPIHVLEDQFVSLSTSLTLTNATVNFEKDISSPKLFNVRGSLTASGTCFSSDATTPAKGDWTGIKVWKGSGSVDLEDCIIQYADVGLQLGSGSGSYGGGTVDDCTFNNNSDEDILVVTPASVTITGGLITTSATTNHVGVHVDDTATSTTVRGVEIVGTSSAGTIGILCENDAALNGNHIHDFSSGTGIKFDTADTTLVASVDNYGETVTELMDNATAIEVAGSARPKIRRVHIDDSGSYGIRVGTGALPDVGTSGDHGECGITNSGLKHISCKTPRLSTLPNVNAQYNWWGYSDSTTLSSKLSSFVNWVPWLEGDPYDLLSAPVGVEMVPSRPAVMQNAPNPFHVTTLIAFRVIARTSHVEVVIFDVAGRVVRNLVNEPAPSGEHSVTWNGRDNAGSAVSSGVYYYRVQIGDEFEETRKLNLVR